LSATSGKAIALDFVTPTVLAIALGLALSRTNDGGMSMVYLAD
jgi:hypothetical protein